MTAVVSPTGDYIALASGFVGPRFRFGSKQRGYLSVTPGLSYLVAKGARGAPEPEGGSGVGLRLEKAYSINRHRMPLATWNFLFFAQGERHGDDSLIVMGAAFAL
jgi:hypothetical protein